MLNLTDEYKAEFVEAFDFELDRLGIDYQTTEDESSNPWGCPWEWEHDHEKWYSENATEAGRAWARECAEEIEELLKEENR